jgi:hypothetical protein
MQLLLKIHKPFVKKSLRLNQCYNSGTDIKENGLLWEAYYILLRILWYKC